MPPHAAHTPGEERVFQKLRQGARRRAAEQLRHTAKPRVVRIHSLNPQPPGAERPDFVRVAFEFTDPPGPYSMQFYEAPPGQASLDALSPGAEAHYYESLDGARTRLLETTDGEPVWPF